MIYGLPGLHPAHLDTPPLTGDPTYRRNAAKQTEWEGHVIGIFEGYAWGRAFELSDGRR